MRVAANQVLQDLVNGFCLAVAFTRTSVAILVSEILDLVSPNDFGMT